jgi:hypothetical protein
MLIFELIGKPVRSFSNISKFLITASIVLESLEKSSKDIPEVYSKIFCALSIMSFD